MPVKTEESYIFPEMKTSLLSRHCQIVASASYLPETEVHTDEIIKKQQFALSSTVIEKSIGPKTRRVAPEGTADSDLLEIVSSECLKKAGIKPEQLSKIIVTKFIGDRLLPMTASMLQSKLNCPQAVQSYDIDGGINSFLQAFDLASKLINMGDEYILIASGGIHRSLISQDDPRSAFLFGDGAAAILLGPSERQQILSSYFFSNYQFRDLMQGFSRIELLREHDFSDVQNQKMAYDLYEMKSWLPAKEFILEAMRTTRDTLLEAANLTEDAIDLYLLTENNKRMWDECVEHLGIREEQTLSLLGSCGNTMSAMLPMQMHQALTTGKIKNGSTCLFLSIGEGINAGGMLYRIN